MIKNRKPLFGVGINDADYVTQPKVDGKYKTCPFYSRWQTMLKRCYYAPYQESQPTYKDCSVCDEWLLFSNFKSWMERQGWEGMQLDKDIIKPGNKVYSPNYCRFITQSLNALLTDNASKRGKFPQGVYYHKAVGKFDAKVNIKGKQKHLGYFATPELASETYIKAKAKLIIQAASEQTDLLIANGLRLHANKLMEQR